MQLKSTVLFLTILIQLLFVPFGSNSKTFQENPLTKAIQLFDKGKYVEAEPLFKKILDQRPDDFMVNFFYGACRTENGHYSEQDLNYLIKASKEVTPLNIDYYFGVQYHAKNQWEKALVYYNLYKGVASENEQEKVNLSLKIEQCTNKINPFTVSDTDENVEKPEVPVAEAAAVTAVATENALKTEENLIIPQSVAGDSAKAEMEEKPELANEDQENSAENDNSVQVVVPVQDTLTVKQPSENQVTETVQPVQTEERIEFNINSEITYLAISNFKTAEGELYFKEGNTKQNELNEVIEETENLRGKYTTSKSRAEKDSIGQQILELEGQTYELKKVVNQMFLQAKTAENGYWQNASPTETENFIKELNALSVENNKNNLKPVNVVESPNLIIPPVVVENEKVETAAPKAKASGITYKIQIGAYSRGIPNNQKQAFNKISVIRKVENYTDANGVVVYTTGNLTNYDDAVVMQNQVRQEGIKDPIIAAYLNGKRITLEQAKETEKKK
jgi:hypothetical protein